MAMSAVYWVLQAFIAYLTWQISKVIRLGYQQDLRKIPGPWLSRFTNVPLKIHALVGDRNSYIDGLHQSYGKFVRVAPNEISVSDIKAYHEIHKVGTRFMKAPWYQKLSPKQYDDETCAVFAIRDQRKAAARRKLFLQAGTPSSVREWEPQIAEIVDKTVAKIKRDLIDKGTADAMKWWTFMTADVLGTIAFGESFGMIATEQKTELVKDVETSIILVGLKLELPWTWDILTTLPIPSFRRFVGLFNRFEKYADTAIANTKLAANGLTKTMFSKMVGPDDQQLPDHVIRQEAVNIIIAGTDTTAMTLTYLVYCVLADQTYNIKKRLLAELEACSEHLSWAELREKQLLNQIIDETLRLYTPVGGSLPRSAPGEGVILGGYSIPGETLVMTQAYTFHTNSEVFKDPLKFDPDRWQSPTPEMREYFMPFGGTARFCLGQNIARLELLYATAKLFRECPSIRLAPSTTKDSMAPLEFFVLKPRGMRCEIMLE